MNNEEITALALASGFKLKEQPGGALALNPYVFDFARALLAAQPASAPVASIDTPEFRDLLDSFGSWWAHRTAQEDIQSMVPIIRQIDAWGQQQRQAGRSDILHPKGFDEEGSRMVTRFITAVNDARERAEKAEASLAGLVEGVTKAANKMYEILPAFPEDVPENSRELWHLHAELNALLPAKSDKPNSFTCAPARTTSDIAYESLSPERRKKLNADMLLLEQRMQDHRRSKERRQNKVPVEVERRVADARGTGVHQDRK